MRPQALPVQAEMGRCTQGMQVFSGRVHSAPDSILNCQQLCGRRQGRDRGKGDTAPPLADPMKDMGSVLKDTVLGDREAHAPYSETRGRLLSGDGGDMGPTPSELPIRQRRHSPHLGRFSALMGETWS